MDQNMFHQWVRSPIQDSVVPGAIANESNVAPTSNNPPSPPIDMSEFTTLNDHGGPSAASIHTPTPHPFYPYSTSYYTPPPTFSLPFAGTQWPAAHVPLSSYSSLNGATTTSSSQPQPQLQSPQQQHPTPHIQQQLQLQPIPSTSQHMMIDPALTMNGPPSASMSSSFSHSPPPYSPTPPQQQQQLQPQQLQAQSQVQQQQQRNQYFNQHILYPYYRQQPQPAPQGTLSPQALHSPTSSLVSLIPSQFYNSHQSQSLVQAGPSQPQPQPQQQQQQRLSPSIPGPIASTSQIAPAPLPLPAQDQPSLEDRRRQFENAIRPLLQPTAFTGAPAVSQLTSLIVEFGPSDVDAVMRLEILARIRDGASNTYYRAWSENQTAMDITREWIKASAKTNNATLVETTMPLLHLIDRLPITLESLRASKLGKIIKKLVKDEPSPAIKDMAFNLEQRWRTLLQSDTDGGTKASENKGNSEDANKLKKRKLPEQSVPPKPPQQATKKAAVGSVSSTKPVAVKKEPTTTSLSALTSTTSVAAVKDAKADSSFFSAPKPKAKLPSFKKGQSASSQVVKKEEATAMMNVALPSTSDPFREILATMAKRDSPSGAAVSTPPSISANNSAESQPGLARNGRRKKVVTWAPEDQLESIKLIERAVYDDDPVDGTHIAHSFRDLDRGEGAALHAPQMFEEMADWAEPMPLDLPPESTDPSKTRGIQSEEKNTQAEREQTALSAMYLPNQIPDSPTEPTTVISEEEVDKDVTQMTAGPEVDAIFWSTDVPAAEGQGAATAASVADLVGQLAMGMDTSMGAAAAPNVAQDAMAAVQQNLQSLPPEQLQQLLQQLQFGAMFGNSAVASDGGWPSNGNAGGTTSQFGTDYGQSGYHEDGSADMQQSRWSTEGRGRGGGRGRGRGRGGRGEDGFRTYIKRKPCSFFAAGRCKYGDQCDFAHDLSLLEH